MDWFSIWWYLPWVWPLCFLLRSFHLYLPIHFFLICNSHVCFLFTSSRLCWLVQQLASLWTTPPMHTILENGMSRNYARMSITLLISYQATKSIQNAIKIFCRIQNFLPFQRISRKVKSGWLIIKCLWLRPTGGRVFAFSYWLRSCLLYFFFPLFGVFLKMNMM